MLVYNMDQLMLQSFIARADTIGDVYLLYSCNGCNPKMFSLFAVDELLRCPHHKVDVSQDVTLVHYDD